MAFFTILFCTAVLFGFTSAQADLSLCSQVYQMHEYCTRDQHAPASLGTRTSHVRTGKAGPRGPPGRSAVVDYELINTKISELVREQAKQQQAQNADKIRQLQNDMKGFERRINLLSGWKEASSGGIFFKIFQDKVNYATAKGNCEKEGAILASKGIRNPAAYREIRAEVKKIGSDAWIGLDDIQQEGRWVWADGVVGGIGDLIWGETQPNNYQGNEDCIHFWSYQNVFNFNDHSCSRLFMYVCERSL